MYVIFTVAPPCVTTSCQQQWTKSDCLNTGALNDRFILNTLQTLFRLSKSLETYSKWRYKIFVWSSEGKVSLFEITRALLLFSQKF